MMRKGDQRPYDDENLYGRRYEEGWENPRDIDGETRERLERYFSRHGEEPSSYRQDERARRDEEQRGQQMLGRGFRPDWDREDFDRAQGEQGHPERYRREEKERTGVRGRQDYWPPEVREEYARRFRPGYDWDREDFDRAKGEQGPPERYRHRQESAPHSLRSSGYRPEPSQQEGGIERFSPGNRKQGPYVGVGPRGYRRSDRRIYEEVCDRLMEHGYIDAGGVEVQVQEGVVTLRGFVADRRTRHEAEDVAESVFGVRQVRNELKMG